ncbi:hypothetical protein ACZ90_31855 [Streptomyces albus subsp. albus]|nr:hypothetical protein ACZ90_31855 [Streptomyces albus subsp. albus]
MTAMASEPPMAWRYCGNQIKLWRTQAQVTREQLAKETNYDYETIRSMETGRRKAALRVLEIADDMCGARGLLLAAQDYLKPEKFRSYAQGYMHYEAEAIAHSSYQPMLIPGLLQTEEYIRALFKANCPPLDDETQEVRLAARLERQQLLDHQTRAFGFAIGGSRAPGPESRALCTRNGWEATSHPPAQLPCARAMPASMTNRDRLATSRSRVLAFAATKQPRPVLPTPDRGLTTKIEIRAIPWLLPTVPLPHPSPRPPWPNPASESAPRPTSPRAGERTSHIWPPARP